MELRTIHVSKELRGVSLSFPARVDVCENCGSWEIPLAEAGHFGAALDAAYRKKAGLLSAAQIREAREHLNMSQRQFAAYVGVGEASIKRWELGALQDKSSDEVIRLRTDPDYARRNLDEICRRLGVDAATEPERHSVFIKRPVLALRPAVSWTTMVDTSAAEGPAGRRGFSSKN